MVATVVVALVCVISFAAASYAALDARASNDIAQEAQRYASHIEAESLDGDELVDFLEDQAQLVGSDKRITLISPDGTVIFVSAVEI